jgi:hypothetical protein
MYILPVAGFACFAVLWWTHRTNRSLSGRADGPAFLLLSAWSVAFAAFLDLDRLMSLVTVYEDLRASGRFPLPELLIRLPEYVLLVVLVGGSLVCMSLPLDRSGVLAGAGHGLPRRRLLLTGLVLAVLVVLGIAHHSPVIDTGYCAAEGAFDLLAGRTPFFTHGVLPSGICHGRVYGIVIYAAYIPAHLVGILLGHPIGDVGTAVVAGTHPSHVELLFAARWTGAVFTLVILWGVYRIGRRTGVENALVLCLAWILFPVVLFPVVLGQNDLVPISLVVLTLAFRDRPVVSGILLGLATQAKMFPVVLFPLILVSHAGRHRLSFLLGFALGNAVPLAFVAWRAELQAYANVLLGRVSGGIDLAFWWTVRGEGLRRLLLPATMAALMLAPLVLHARRPLERSRVLPYGIAGLSVLLFMHNCPHPGLLALPVTLLLIDRFAGEPGAEAAMVRRLPGGPPAGTTGPAIVPPDPPPV